MDKEQTEKVIEAFNRYHAPFYIVDLEDGQYSLCHPMGVTGSDFGQAAFDLYAMAIGEKTCETTWRAHGNGYEWEDVFRKYFENDLRIEEIHFDCEYGGFFCDCKDLQVLLDMGHRFYEVASDAEKFAPIVMDGIKAGNARRASEKSLMKTVRGQLMQNPTATFYIRTPQGDAVVTPEILQEMFSGKQKSVYMKDTVLSAEELLNQTVCGVQQDLLDENVIRMKTEKGQEENLTEGIVQKL